MVLKTFTIVHHYDANTNIVSSYGLISKIGAALSSKGGKLILSRSSSEHFCKWKVQWFLTIVFKSFSCSFVSRKKMIIASLENPSFSNPTEASECIPFSKEDSVSVTAIKAARWYRFCFWETRLSLLPKTDTCGTLRTIWSETWQCQIYFFLHLRCQENWDRYSLAFAGMVVPRSVQCSPL